MRKQLEGLIQSLIDLLDTLSADPDCEHDTADFEPILAGFYGSSDDREIDDAERGEPEDAF